MSARGKAHCEITESLCPYGSLIRPRMLDLGQHVACNQIRAPGSSAVRRRRYSYGDFGRFAHGFRGRRASAVAAQPNVRGARANARGTALRAPVRAHLLVGVDRAERFGRRTVRSESTADVAARCGRVSHRNVCTGERSRTRRRLVRRRLDLLVGSDQRVARAAARRVGRFGGYRDRIAIDGARQARA